VWRGNPKNMNDHNRSMDRAGFDELVYALRADGNGLWSLQIGEGADWADPHPEFQHFAWAPSSPDWLDTAKALRRIDRLVTIDSAVMHLSASLGVHTWGLLCYAHDWRYPEMGNLPEWYPNLSLIRQERPRDWESAIASLLRRMGEEGHTIRHDGYLRPLDQSV
jgi:hypothetical protein